jgi:hypothetical protein
MARRSDSSMPVEPDRSDSGGSFDDRTRAYGDDESIRGVSDDDDEFEDIEDLEEDEEAEEDGF